MERTLKNMLTEDIFGRKIVRLDCKPHALEISGNGNKWEISVIRPFCRNEAWKICDTDGLIGERVPVFPNMMLAYKYLKENWKEIY